jgi:hypothetical protein
MLPVEVAALPNRAEVVVVYDLRTARKPYRAPSFEVVDVTTAKAKLEEKGITKESREMLSLIEWRLERRAPARRSPSSRKPRP